MLFPAIDYCLVCEIVRPEPGGTLNILGFYSPIPYVRIVLDSQDEVTTLTFVLGLGRVSGKFTVVTNIIGPDKSIVATALQGELEFEGGYFRTQLVCPFAPFLFRQEGEHIFELLIDNQIKYTAAFNVSLTPKET